MKEITFSPKGAQNAIYQIIELMAELVSEKVSDKLEQNGYSFIQQIEVKEKITENSEELLTVKDLERILKVKKGAIYDWRNKGILMPDTYIGRSPRYKRSSIDEFINNKR